MGINGANEKKEEEEFICKAVKVFDHLPHNNPKFSFLKAEGEIHCLRILMTL